MAPDLSSTHPRVLIVSRRTLRKNKLVDFVGEYHLDLIVKFGAVPIIVPRVHGVDSLLESFEPIHGVLLCEGEDVDSSLYAAAAPDLTSEAVEEIRRLHASDTAIDREKDSIETRLAVLCLRRGVPFLGICRGSQVLNVAAGGSLYFDVETELELASSSPMVKHIDYENYDGHRHAVEVVEETPLGRWFGEREIMVNSYHHQGVKRLAERFVPMAFAPDGLVEGFYDPEGYEPEEGKFVVGLQFHPERMRRPDSDEFDYPGCESAYQEFVKAAIAYQKKVMKRSTNWVLRAPKEMDTKIKNYDRSYSTRSALHPIKESQHEAQNQLLEPNTALSVQQEKRLKQMGATVRNGTFYLQRLKLKEDKEKLARNLMGKMSVEQLSDLLSVYHMMGHICSQVLENKINGLAV